MNHEFRQKIITEFFRELFSSKTFKQFVSGRKSATIEDREIAINEVIQEIAEYATVTPEFSRTTLVEFIKICAIDAHPDMKAVPYFKYQFCRMIIEQYLTACQWKGCQIRIENMLEHLKLGKDLRFAKELINPALLNVDGEVKSVLTQDLELRQNDWLASDFAYGFMLMAKQAECIYIEHQQFDSARYKAGNKYNRAKSVFEKLADSYSQNYTNLHAVRAYQAAKKANDTHALESLRYCETLVDYPMYYHLNLAA